MVSSWLTERAHAVPGQRHYVVALPAYQGLDLFSLLR